MTIDPSKLSMAKPQVMVPMPMSMPIKTESMQISNPFNPEPMPVSKPVKPEPSISAEEKKAIEVSSGLDYDMLLISLSDEYIAAAHKLGPKVAVLEKEGDVEAYNGLIAAGLGCLEAALRVSSLKLDCFVTVLILLGIQASSAPRGRSYLTLCQRHV
jgi:hypothetical protein